MENQNFSNLSSVEEHPQRFVNWDMNYLEAAIFLQEGENNDKFDSHPRKKCALPAYLVTHNHWFYLLDLFSSLLLLFLAVMEEPSIGIFKNIPIGVHGSLELFGLSLLGISIIMHIRWLGWKTFIHHKRSLLKSIIWLIMVFESLAVLIKYSTHFRVTRALRPIFLIDSRYLGGVRRFLRQIFQSLLPILEVLVLLLFTLLVFAILGFYLFSKDKSNPYFTTFFQSFVSLYVLLTTANYPDVMMPSYAKTKWSAAFFIAYLAIMLYFLTNLMLAIVFVVFSDLEKEKFRKLLLHKRAACSHAFKLLVSKRNPNALSFNHFEGVMGFFNRNLSRIDIYLIFKALNKSNTGKLSHSEFVELYNVLEYNWSFLRDNQPWFHDLYSPIKSVCFLIRSLVLWKWFKAFVYSVILLSASSLLIQTIFYSENEEAIISVHANWEQLTCVSFYVVEVTLKLIGLGVYEYFKSGWNSFDFIVIVLSVSGIIAQNFHSAFYYVVILRPLRLLRLFKLRKRYRDIFQTFGMLLPTIFSAVIVIIIIFYFFAIVGMEIFSHYDMKNCCVNSTVEQYYKDDNTTLYVNYYYLNNFNDLFMAGVTLFELTIVNNWFIIMEGYAYVSGEWSRIYFMVFFLVMMIVMSLVMAFILEAFTFKMHYNETFKDSESSEENKILIVLKKEEMDFIFAGVNNLKTLRHYATFMAQREQVPFEGVQKQTKLVLQRRMYRDMIQECLNQNTALLSSVDSTPCHSLTTPVDLSEVSHQEQVPPWFETLTKGEECPPVYSSTYPPIGEEDTDGPIFPSTIQASPT